MSKKIKDEQKKFLGETLNQYDKALDEAINQLDKKNREQNHKISSLVNSFDNEFLEKDVEGNMATLENSKDGMVIINEIQGNTEVNYCKDGEKELVLNGDIDTQGESFVTITEGVDGGLVDVSLEGNTEINLSKTKDPVLVTREFDDINCNVGKLQYTIDDVTTINDEPGKVDIDRIVGDTMVNHAVNGSEELILNANINESGDNNIILNGVTSDGGKVDVALEGNTLVNVSKTKNTTPITKEGEDITGNHIALADEGSIRPVLSGNTMVNVCDQKNPITITKSYTVETGNHVALQGEYDGKCRPVVTGNTLWIDNDTEEVLTAFDNSKNLRLQSSFEDKVVTQEMVDNGEELAENLGKYKVDYVISKEDGTVGQTKTFYLNSPLLEGDTIEQQGNNVVHVHRYKKIVLDGSENWKKSHMFVECYYVDDYYSSGGLFAEVNILCPTFKSVSNYDFNTNRIDGSICASTNTIGITLKSGTLSYDTLDAFKEWLQSNPLTVVYKLASPQYEVISQNGTILCDSYVNGHLDVDSVVPVEKVDFLPFTDELTYLYPSTQYTVQFVSDAVSKVDITLGGAKLLNQDVVVGTNKYMITTPSTLVNNKLVLNGENFNASNIVVTEATDQEFGYFEGMKSCFEDNLVTEGENAGKYRVEYKVSDSEGVEQYTKTLYLNSPLLEGDTIEEKDGNIYHVHRYNSKAYETGDENTYITDLINTVCPLETPTYELTQQGTIVMPTYSAGHLDVTTAVPLGKVNFLHFEEELTYLYPSTSYTVQFVSDKAITADITLGGKELLEQSIIKGLNKITITTPETLTDNKLIIDGVGTNIKEVVVTNSDREFGYFEGMKSVGECEDLEVVSRTRENMKIFDSQKLINEGTIFYTRGWWAIKVTTEVTRLKIVVTNKDGLARNTKLAVQDSETSVDNFVDIFAIHEKFDKKELDYELINSNTLVFCSYGDNDFKKDFFDYYDIEVYPQGEIGSSVKSNTQTLTHEPLRAVGDIKDKYVLIDGKWYIERNCGEEVFDGSDVSKITYYPDNSTNNTAIFTIKVDNRKSGGLCLCDKFINFSGNIWNVAERNDKECISSTVSDLGIILSISKYKLSSVNPDGLGLYLQSNPIIVVYELQTPTYEPINYIPLEVYSGITHITTNSAIPTNITIKNHGYNLVALKENTQYTLYVNKNTTNALTYRLGDYVEINSLNKFTFTTPSTLTDKTLRIDGKGTEVNDLMLIEGTPTNDSVGYFDGLKSSYECEQVTDENDEHYGKYRVNVKVTGKNLFDKSKTLDGYEIANILTGVLRENADWFVTDFIPVIPNTSYRISGKAKGAVGLCYDKNKQLISSLPSGCDGAITITIPNNVRYVKLNGLLTQKDTFQLEKGNTASEYEPYFDSKQTVYLNSPLLKGDEIVWKDNKIQHYHKMETIVLDGSEDENWIKQWDDWDTDNRITFKISLPKSNLQWWVLENEINTAQNRLSKKVSSDKFTYIYNIPNGSINEFMGQDGNIGNFGSSARYLVIGLPKAKLQTQDVAGFKQWLQQNPVKVVYQLAEPTYEEISDYPLKLNVIANSSLSTESTIQVTNISFNIYEETLPYLYPNTKYYITFNADVDRNNIIIDLGGSHIVFDCKVGFNKVEITTPSDATNLLTFSGTGVNIDHVKVTQQDIDEYFEGMKSVDECEGNTLEIICKNNDNSKSNTQTLTHEPLRSVGDIKDKYVLIDGKWYIERNIICIDTTSTTDNIDKVISWGWFGERDTEELATISIKTNKYFKENSNLLSNAFVQPYLTTNNWLNFRVKKSELSSITITNDILKEWCYRKKVIICAQLQTPTYEPIDYNPFEVYSDITHISNNSLIPANMVIKNHGYNTILKPSTKYTVALNKPSGTISAKLGGSAKVDSTNSVFTITTPSTLNDNILRLSGSGNIKDIMVLEGDKTVNTPNYFEGIESVFEQEYDTEKGKYRVNAKVVGDGKESTITFYINEPLRGTATSKDKVFIKDNKVIVQRNIKEMLLNGSEDWKYRETRFDGYLYTLDIPDLKKYGVNTYEQGYTDRFYMKDLLPFGAFFEYVNGRDICLQLPLALGGDNANVIKDWLNVNNTRVVYELAEPTYEEADCDLSKLVLENYENSSLIFESNIPVSANIRYSGEVPVVTQAKSLSSQVDNTTLDINENIIPYMCDIDYRIVELQLMNGDTQGEGIELLGIGDIEILSNENVLFNNREDKKYNYSYDMLKRDILSQRYSKEEYQYRLDRYLLANKISDEEYKELEGLLNNGE